MTVEALAPPPRPLVLAVEPDPVFGTFHDAPIGIGDGTAVLICPPWGWDEVTSYRARAAWASRLAAEGHPTLRIDLPSSGDSAGLAGDPGRVRAWTRAISGAAAWLVDRPGTTRVVAIALGLGGLLAAAALADGAAIADLVLWAVPESGRAFLREQRAFAGLQVSRIDVDDSGPPAVEDGLEVGGFRLSAETIAALERLGLVELLGGRAERILFLDRDGLGKAHRSAGRLAAAGSDVTEDRGDGWAAMVFHPEQYAAPTAVFDRVSAWLHVAGRPDQTAGTARDPGGPSRSVAARDGLELVLGGRIVNETALRIRRPSGDLFGILARPADGPTTGLSAIFLNAGAVRRIGPNRMWVETARRWAGRGVASIRMDLEGIGDADGDPRRYTDVGNFYTPEFGASVGAILDRLTELGLGPRFVLVGLCAGAYWALHTAADDPRVVAALILNPRAMIWDAGLLARRDARKLEQLRTPGTWRRLVRGEIGAGRIAAVSTAVASTAVRGLTRAPGRALWRLRSSAGPDPVETILQRLSDRGTRVLLAFSGDEPVHDELEAAGVLEHLERWPTVELVALPGRDHTLRPLVAQRAASALLDRELERLLDREQGDSPAS